MLSFEFCKSIQNSFFKKHIQLNAFEQIGNGYNLFYDWLLIIIVLCRFIAENFTTVFLYQYAQTRGIFRTLSNIYGGVFTKTANGF